LSNKSESVTRVYPARTAYNIADLTQVGWHKQTAVT
jgi:hypothetical protein